MSTTPPHGDNPQGLASFDPMKNPRYRAAARTFLDDYLRRNGMNPCVWPEDATASEQPVEVVDDEPVAPSPMARAG